MLAAQLRSSSLTRDEELAVRSMAAEAALLQDDLDQAATALGRTPDTFRDTIRPGRLSTLWRLHGRLASARADQSRAIALHQRALKLGEIAHDLRAIGLAHYELAQCYRQVGDVAIVREHITKAGSALQASGDRRYLALLHSLASITVAQTGRYDEAMGALRQAERFASGLHAGAVFDTLAQIHLIRGHYDTAGEFLGRAGEAYGAYGRHTSSWYEWSVRVLGARLALRRGDFDDAVRRADAITDADAPPFDALQ